MSAWNRERVMCLLGACVRAWVILVLIVIVIAETIVILHQGHVNDVADTQSDKLLNAFLSRDTTTASPQAGVPIRLRNVRFKWSDKVYVDASDMAVRAVPLRGSVVDFDDMSSFYMAIGRSTVTLRPEVLEGMLNESVFNYPHSHIRDLEVTLDERKGVRGMRMKGSVKAMVWVPFDIFAHLEVDRRTNTLVFVVNKAKALGFIPATGLLKAGPFKLKTLVTLPPNGSLMISGSNFMVKPFGLFPPPRINGRIESVEVDQDVIRLRFSGAPVDAPKSQASNYVYLRGGQSQFGNFRMTDTNALIIDRTPKDVFVFSLQHYADLIPRSEVDLDNTKSVRLVMPDFQ